MKYDNYQITAELSDDNKITISYSDYSEEKTDNDGTIFYIQSYSPDGYIDLTVTGEKNEDDFVLKETTNDLSISN